MPKIKKNNNKKLEKLSTSDCFYAVGRRKTAVAQVRLYKGKGDIFVNKKKVKDYFPEVFYNKLIEPLSDLSFEGKYDIYALVLGGGLSAQADAIKLGISRALLKEDPKLKATLKKSKFLTRDSRVVERKKPGKKKARKSPQWAKR
ncbi:30S ribosomal protein S9 [Patescibacteria group bacterium]|nr:30S ribosomal protein S9 [Patescibacteria group bacterium]